MSALSCGCDQESGWMCQKHLAASQQRFQQHLATEEAMKDTQPAGQNPMLGKDYVPAYPSAAEQFRREAVRIAQQTPTPPSREMREISLLDARIDAMQAIINDLTDERNRIAYVLRTFYFAPMSLSTLQPLIALAIEMNPEIVEQKR